MLYISSSNEPYAIDYSVHPIPSDGRCPTNKFGLTKETTFSNTTVDVVHHIQPPQSVLLSDRPF